jgi:hypothetical protein
MPDRPGNRGVNLQASVLNGGSKMTRVKFILGIAFATSIAMSAGITLAQSSPSAAIADGQPWNTIGPRGRAMTLTFYPDGSVRIDMGTKRMSMTWEPTDDGMCLSGGPGGEKCITFIKTDTGYQGVENGQVTMQLSR